MYNIFECLHVLLLHPFVIYNNFLEVKKRLRYKSCQRLVKIKMNMDKLPNHSRPEFIASVVMKSSTLRVLVMIDSTWLTSSCLQNVFLFFSIIYFLAYLSQETLSFYQLHLELWDLMFTVRLNFSLFNGFSCLWLKVDMKKHSHWRRSWSKRILIVWKRES